MDHLSSDITNHISVPPWVHRSVLAGALCGALYGCDKLTQHSSENPKKSGYNALGTHSYVVAGKYNTVSDTVTLAPEKRISTLLQISEPAIRKEMKSCCSLLVEGDPYQGVITITDLDTRSKLV